MFGRILFFVYLFIWFYDVEAGLFPMFEILQDDVTIDKNELTEYMEMNASITDAGTLDASTDFYITVLKDVPSNFNVKITTERKDESGEYVPQSLKVDRNYCEFLKSDKILIPLVKKFSNFATECPIKPGNYHMKGVTLKGYQLPVALPLGDYRFNFFYSIGEKVAAIVWKGRFVKV